MNELKEYLNNQTTRWLNILNEEYTTDSGASLEEHALGRLKAYNDILNFIKVSEEEDGRSTKETGRTRNSTQA
tara:strand:- start:317 stop:535 length:219 start_codon:yes stop_codon:yes gene_type:complete